MSPDASDVRAYYTGALAGLRAIEHAKPTERRFGANADARWASLRGDLTTADRLDLLLRDADAHWAGAFGARTVFALGGVSEDDPFGADWPSLDPIDAEELWRAALARQPAREPREALMEAAKAWLGVPAPAPVETPAIAAADKLLVVGGGAIAATAAAFARGSDLDWADQVVCIATPPAHRQLAAMTAGLLNASRACPILAHPEVTPSRSRDLRLGARRLIISDDAHADDAAMAQQSAELEPA